MITKKQALNYRQAFAAGESTFLQIREQAGLSCSGVEFLLTGRTFKEAGGPLIKSFVGVTTMFPSEKKRRVEWKKEYMKKYHRKRAREYKKRALDLLGGKCVKCGSTEYLEFDHIDPSMKTFHIGSQITGSWEETEKELKKCQLLCRRCHHKKSAEEMAEFNAVVFSGERGVGAKLADIQAAEYRRRFANGSLTMKTIAAETGMSTKNVRLMLRGITYRHAGGPLATAEEAINYITPERKQWYKEEVVRLFESGVTRLSDICERVPISSPTAKTYLVAAGLLEKDQNLKINQKHAKLTHDQVREYREQFARGGITMTTIAREIGMSIAGVSRFLKGGSYASARGPLLG
jgi:AraC-like DNA-binding protein